MHAAERERLILKLLQANGFVSFRQLDGELDGSPATVRRDLARMEAKGLIARVHGGARLAEQANGPIDQLLGTPFHENIKRNPEAKAAIGRAAAALCEPGESIIIDGGSTTLQMCRHIDKLDLQVLTNSLHIVSALLPQTRTRVSLPAGTVYREQNIVLSPHAEDGSRQHRASKMFVGAASVGASGLMQADALLLHAEGRLMDLADQLVLTVDSSKFHAPPGNVLCALDEIDIVITDRGIEPRHKRMLREAGVRVIVANA